MLHALMARRVLNWPGAAVTTVVICCIKNVTTTGVKRITTHRAVPASRANLVRKGMSQSTVQRVGTLASLSKILAHAVPLASANLASAEVVTAAVLAYR